MNITRVMYVLIIAVFLITLAQSLPAEVFDIKDYDTDDSLQEEIANVEDKPMMRLRRGTCTCPEHPTPTECEQYTDPQICAACCGWQRIFNSQDPESLPDKPVVQVMGVKKLQSNANAQERYRLIISDGLHYYTSAMLGTQLNSLVTDGRIEPKCVARLDHYTSNIIQATRKVVIILGMTVLTSAKDVSGKIGNPQSLPDANAAGGNARQEEVRPAPAQPQRAVPQNNQANRGNASSVYTSARNSTPQANRSTGSTSHVNVHPISSLTPYQNRWTIRARITNKAPIRHWSNSKGEGKLFSMDLLDETGEIRATAFNDAVDKYHDMIEKDKVYYFSKCTLRTANKQYTSLKNDYEMQFTNDTIVELCEDKCDLPKIQYTFVQISDLENQNKDAFVDIIAVVKSAAETTQITTRATNKQVSKRDLTLVDRSEKCVSATIWGAEAESYEQYANSNPIVAIKGAKVSDFGGRSLSIMGSSVFNIDPDIEEAHSLRGWYDTEGKNKTMESLSGQRSDYGGSSKYKTISQIKAEGLGMSEKADYFQLRPMILSFRRDTALYRACPTKDCNKKVIENNGSWRCEKCDKTFPDFKYRMILQTNVADFTGNQWLTCFQESGEKLLAITAEELGNLKDTNEDEYDMVFSKATLQPFNLTVRAKMETYNDEARLKCSALAAEPMNFKDGAKALLREINQMRSM